MEKYKFVPCPTECAKIWSNLESNLKLKVKPYPDIGVDRSEAQWKLTVAKPKAALAIFQWKSFSFYECQQTYTLQISPVILSILPVIFGPEDVQVVKADTKMINEENY